MILWIYCGSNLACGITGYTASHLTHEIVAQQINAYYHKILYMAKLSLIITVL
jgi:hypothetical protein